MHVEKVNSQLEIEKVDTRSETQAREIILEGMRETYNGESKVLFVGFYQGKLICTGGLIREDRHTGRIVRMSVAKDYRRKGFAKVILARLEDEAAQKGYSKMVLETNQNWVGAIGLYKGLGYSEDFTDVTLIHMSKRLDGRGQNKGQPQMRPPLSK